MNKRECRTACTRQARAVPDRKSRNPFFGGIVTSQVREKEMTSRQCFNFTYRYMDDFLSRNNTEFENYLGQMYPVELEIKDTTESNTSASYLDLLLSIGSDG